MPLSLFCISDTTIFKLLTSVSTDVVSICISCRVFFSSLLLSPTATSTFPTVLSRLVVILLMPFRLSFTREFRLLDETARFDKVVFKLDFKFPSPTISLTLSITLLRLSADVLNSPNRLFTSLVISSTQEKSKLSRLLIVSCMR